MSFSMVSRLSRWRERTIAGQQSKKGFKPPGKSALGDSAQAHVLDSYPSAVEASKECFGEIAS